MQTNYTDGVSISHGVTNKNGSSPLPTVVSFLKGEVITNITGKAGHGWNFATFYTSLGNKTELGSKHSGGDAWNVTGPVYGFFGSTCVKEQGCPFEGGDKFINGLGVWAAAPPPPTPGPAVRADAWNTHTFHKAGYSDWDDGAHPGDSALEPRHNNVFVSKPIYCCSSRTLCKAVIKVLASAVYGEYRYSS